MLILGFSGLAAGFLLAGLATMVAALLARLPVLGVAGAGMIGAAFILRALTDQAVILAQLG